MASTYLTRTQTAGNRRTFTWSAWIKRGDVSRRQTLLSAGIDGSNESYLRFDASDYISIKESTGNSPEFLLDTTPVFRDPAAWYHIVFAVDTTQSTASDRVKLYVNGSQITSFSSASYPSENYETRWGNNSQATYLGFNVSDAQDIYDGYMSEVHFIDGTAYAPTTFGETDTTGVWKPIVGPSVTYGTNGYYLKFENSGAMGTDSSGNSNTLSVGAGTARQMPDTPTNVFAALNPVNVTAGTLSNGNLYYSQGSNWTNGVTGTQSFSAGKWYWEAKLVGTYSFIGIQDVDSDQTSNTADGAYRWTYNSNTGNKYNNTTYTSYGDAYSDGEIVGVAFDADNGTLTFYNEGVSQGTAFSSLDTSKRYAAFVNAYGSNLILNFGQNGTFNGTETAQGNADGNSVGDFYYSPPSGYLALCTDNLSSELTIPVNKGADNFNPIIYTGTGSTQSMTGVGFQPDWVWIKKRNSAAYHQLFDSVRGATKALFTNYTGPEAVDSGNLQSFTADGFTADGFGGTNGNGDTYVAWNWKAGTSAPSNTYAVKVVSDSGNKYRFDDFGTSAITLELQEGGTFTFDQSDSSNAGHPIRFSTTSDGTHGGGSEYTTGVTTNGTPGQAGAYTRITVAASAPTLYYYCSVHSGMGGQANTGSLFGFTNVKGSVQCVTSPNTTAGFSIVNVPTTGSVLTAGHGLSKAPSMIIFKSRDKDDYWPVYHASIGATKFLVLNTTADAATGSTLFNDTAPSSTVFTMGTQNAFNNANQETIAYCFAELEGYSKMSSYTGNANADGPFVYTGFKPAFVYLKKLGVNHHVLYDDTRDTYNPAEKYIRTNTNDAESTSQPIDFLSNGFKLRHTDDAINASGGAYIYMAIAENPFVTSTGKPVTAR